MGVGAGLYMCDVLKKFTFAISSPDEFLLVILYNAPILKFARAIFFAISILNPNYDVINDVISGFAKVVVERRGFHHWIAQRISWREVVSVFVYLL